MVELANNAKLAYQHMVEDYEKEECETLIEQSKFLSRLSIAEESIDGSQSHLSTTDQNSYASSNKTAMNPRIPSHMGHSRNASNGSNISIEPFNYHMNYHTHSRNASGTFNYGNTISSLGGGATTAGVSGNGHARSASNGGTFDFNYSHSGMPWMGHHRTPSNCSNISMISRLSEPTSEIGSSNLPLNNIPNNNSSMAHAAVQFYSDQVRQEMRECNSISNQTDNQSENKNNPQEPSIETPTNKESLSTLHLGRISEIEIDAGNEADTEDCDLNEAK